MLEHAKGYPSFYSQLVCKLLHIPAGPDSLLQPQPQGWHMKCCTSEVSTGDFMTQCTHLWVKVALFLLFFLFRTRSITTFPFSHWRSISHRCCPTLGFYHAQEGQWSQTPSQWTLEKMSFSSVMVATSGYFWALARSREVCSRKRKLSVFERLIFPLKLTKGVKDILSNTVSGFEVKGWSSSPFCWRDFLLNNMEGHIRAAEMVWRYMTACWELSS